MYKFVLKLQDEKLTNAGVLSANVKDKISEFKNQKDAPYLLISGFDFKPPQSGYSKANKLSEDILYQIADLLGKPHSNQHHQNKNIIHDLYPKKSDTTKQLGTNAEDFLFWHTENAHEIEPPKYVALACIRGDAAADTLIANISDFPFDKLDSKRLSQEVTISSDESFVEYSSHTSPTLLQNECPVYRFDPLYTKSSDHETDELLKRMSKYFSENNVRINLESGDIVIINNHICCHSRTEFTPQYKGQDRWIQRIMISS